jgi:hypothetical protein
MVKEVTRNSSKVVYTLDKLNINTCMKILNIYKLSNKKTVTETIEIFKMSIFFIS